METSGASKRISAAEAAAAMAAVRDSQRRARRLGFPVWFWLATGLGLAAMPLCSVPEGVSKGLLPHAWLTAISLASLALIVGTVTAVYVRALPGALSSRVRLADCARHLWLVLWPVLCYVAVVVAGSITWGDHLWDAPVAPLVTAVAAFAAWSGLGMAFTTFSVFRSRA